MAESPSFRTGYMSLLLPSSTGDLEVRSSIRNCQRRPKIDPFSTVEN